MNEVPDDGGGEGEEDQPQDEGEPHGCPDLIGESEMTIKPKPVDDHTSFLLKSKRQQSQQRGAVSYIVDTYSDIRSRFS